MAAGISITIYTDWDKSGKPQWTFHKNGAEVKNLTRDEYLEVAVAVHKVYREMASILNL